MEKPIMEWCVEPMLEMPNDFLDQLDSIFTLFFKGRPECIHLISNKLVTYIVDLSLSYEVNQDDLVELISWWAKKFTKVKDVQVKDDRIRVFCAFLFSEASMKGQSILTLSLDEFTESEWNLLADCTLQQLKFIIKHNHVE